MKNFLKMTESRFTLNGDFRVGDTCIHAESADWGVSDKGNPIISKNRKVEILALVNDGKQAVVSPITGNASDRMFMCDTDHLREKIYRSGKVRRIS